MRNGGSQKSEDRKQTAGTGRRKTDSTVCLLAFCLTSVLCLLSSVAYCQEDAVRLVEAKRLELKQKEESLKREEARLTALRKDVEEKIASYNKLLARMDEVLGRLERREGENIENVVKAYEVMAPEDAARRLAALDEKTLLKIMTRMKSKKAGAIMAVMDPAKTASLTKRMTERTVKHPGQ